MSQKTMAKWKYLWTYHLFENGMMMAYMKIIIDWLIQKYFLK